jgi:hypothetical protein
VERLGLRELAGRICRQSAVVGEQRRGCLEQWVQIERAGGSGAVEFEAAFGLERVVELCDRQSAEVVWPVAEDQSVL